MMKSMATPQHHQEEEEEDEYEEKGETMKVEGKGSEQKTNTNRSKHSETEQRRRSKINERFQTLRNLIPQNDQKRDKASFLLEVIEYIQFLQEKSQMYDGSYPGWGQEPTKLSPWRNHQGLGESFIDDSQVLKNGSICENNIVIPSMLANTQNSIESDLGNAAVYKPLDHPPCPATSMVNLQPQPNTFSTHGTSNILAQSFHESASDSDNMLYRPQFQSWQSRESITESAIPNNSANEQDLTIRGETEGMSSVYSQGVLNSLTQALQSSGVDMTQANISVQIDVSKRVGSRLTSMASSSKDKERQYTSNEVIPQTGVNNYIEESDQAYKRRRTEKRSV